MKALDHLLQRWRIRVAMPFVRQGDRLLDVGCHNGSLIDRCLPRIQAAVGVDTEVEPRHQGPVEYRRGAFPDDFEFEEASFDCITMLAVLEHVEDLARLASECARILAAGGRLILTVPHPTVDRVLDVLIFLRLADGIGSEDHHGFDVRQTPAIFETAGLRLATGRRFQLGLNNLYVFEKHGP